jgi:hypothetical protein
MARSLLVWLVGVLVRGEETSLPPMACSVFTTDVRLEIGITPTYTNQIS